MKKEVELLQECKLQLEFLNKKFGETGTTNSLIAKIDDLSKIYEQSETNVHLIKGLSKEPLPNNACVEFSTGMNNKNKITVYVREDGIVDVNTNSRIGQDLIILPRAANSFYLSFIDKD